MLEISLHSISLRNLVPGRKARRDGHDEVRRRMNARFVVVVSVRSMLLTKTLPVSTALHAFHIGWKRKMR